MSDSIDSKLDELHKIFHAKLPEKLNEIIILWKNVEENASEENIILFHRKIHSLHGSAATYGFEEIGKEAQECEATINQFLRQPQLVSQYKTDVIAHLEKLLQLVEYQ